MPASARIRGLSPSLHRMKSSVRYEDLRATATLDVDTNAGGQSRVLRITIDASLSLGEEDEDTFERVRKIMSRGCLVTGSLHDGIEMAYNLTPNYRED